MGHTIDAMSQYFFVLFLQNLIGNCLFAAYPAIRHRSADQTAETGPVFPNSGYNVGNPVASAFPLLCCHSLQHPVTWNSGLAQKIIYRFRIPTVSHL